MTLKIFHSGDIHIGMKFNNYPPYIQQKLIKARYKILDTLIKKANKKNANLFVISGDLFDKHNIKEDEIIEVINKLKKFSGDAILILPGNHDFDNGGIELWEKFKNNMSGKIVLLNDFREYDLKKFDLDVSIYPAPCDSKHSAENNLDWIKNKNTQEESPKRKYEIGISHGAISGLSPDMTDSYFTMSKDELKNLNMDIWLLGHTHLPYPFEKEITNRKIFNCGTPEPDGLDCDHSGNAWFIEIDKEKNINAKRITTGQYHFYDLEYKINSKKDFENMKNKLLKGKVENKIIRLKLKGRIEENLYQQKEEIYHELSDKIAYLKINDNDLKIKITNEVINSEFTENSFPYKLLNDLKDDEKALQIAYEFIKEVKA